MEPWRNSLVGDLNVQFRVRKQPLCSAKEKSRTLSTYSESVIVRKPRLPSFILMEIAHCNFFSTMVIHMSKNYSIFWERFVWHTYYIWLLGLLEVERLIVMLNEQLKDWFHCFFWMVSSFFKE